LCTAGGRGGEGGGGGPGGKKSLGIQRKTKEVGGGRKEKQHCGNACIWRVTKAAKRQGGATDEKRRGKASAACDGGLEGGKGKERRREKGEHIISQVSDDSEGSAAHVIVGDLATIATTRDHVRHERLLYTAVEHKQEQLSIQHIANERIKKQEAARRAAIEAVYTQQKKIAGNAQQGVLEQHQREEEEINYRVEMEQQRRVMELEQKEREKNENLKSKQR
jgi:hypothetical protein